MENIGLLTLLITSFYSYAECAGFNARQNGFMAGNDMGTSCNTPQRGSCIPLTNCNYVMNIIKNEGLSSWNAQKFLNYKGCGFEGFTPKVCCPQNSGNNGNVIEQPNNPNQDLNTNNNFPSRTTTQRTTTKRAPTKKSPVNPLFLLPMNCGIQISNRLIGGEKTELGEFPWMALLEYEQRDAYGRTYPSALACGGTLINKRYVLTAAHCIMNTPSYMHLKNVRLGENNVKTDPDCFIDNIKGERKCADNMLSVPIESATVHEAYNKPSLYRNDIALLRLRHDVAFSDYVKPICLPTTAAASEVYWAAGWGAMETRRSSDVKLKVKLTPADWQACARQYITKGVTLGNDQMCIGGVAGKDTCKGDSGGPLMHKEPQRFGEHRWVLDGVVSIGHTPCALDQWPGVYTKVHSYVNWILNNLKP